MKAIVLAMVLTLNAGFAHADVYQWRDSKGEMHYGDEPGSPDAKKIMTQEQIQQEEAAEKAEGQAKPQLSQPDYSKEALDEIQNREDECQRYRNRRSDMLLNSGPTLQPGYGAYGYGRYYNDVPDNLNANGGGLTEVEAGIRKYCRE